MSRHPLERIWKRQAFFNRFWRFGNIITRSRIPGLHAFMRLVGRIVFQADVPFSAKIPKGVVFAHNGLGVVVHTRVKFEAPCLVFHHVTLGNSQTVDDGEPQIGPRVLIGAGACVLGKVRIGGNTIIAANAVVTRDVPSGSLVFGNPMQIRPVNPATLDHVFGPAELADAE